MAIPWYERLSDNFFRLLWFLYLTDYILFHVIKTPYSFHRAQCFCLSRRRAQLFLCVLKTITWLTIFHTKIKFCFSVRQTKALHTVWVRFWKVKLYLLRHGAFFYTDLSAPGRDDNRAKQICGILFFSKMRKILSSRFLESCQRVSYLFN